MDKNTNKPQQNRSMFLYTALIFVVALILIIIAFFGQTNIQNLRKSTEQLNTAATDIPSATESPSASPTEAPDELAVLANNLSALKTENEALLEQIKVYEALMSANSYISSELYDEAQAAIADIDPDSLTEDAKVLYEQISKNINEREDI